MRFIALASAFSAFAMVGGCLILTFALPPMGSGPLERCSFRRCSNLPVLNKDSHTKNNSLTSTAGCATTVGRFSVQIQEIYCVDSGIYGDR